MKIQMPLMAIALLIIGMLPLFGSEEQINAVRTLIEKKAFLTDTDRAEMLSLSRNLNYETKAILYIRNEKNGFNGFLFNLILPSLGSFIEQDYCGGWIILGSMAGGFGILFLADLLNEPMNYSQGTASVIGIGAIIAAYLVNYIVPWVYAADYNHKLMQGLGFVADIRDHSMAPYCAVERKKSNDNKLLLNLDLLTLCF